MALAACWAAGSIEIEALPQSMNPAESPRSDAQCQDGDAEGAAHLEDAAAGGGHAQNQLTQLVLLQ